MRFVLFFSSILFLRKIELLLPLQTSNESERNSISTFACGPVCCPDDADVDSGGKGRLSWGGVPLDSALSVVLGLARCLEAVARRTAHSHARACAAQAQTQSCSGCGSGKGGVPDGRAGTGTDMRRVCVRCRSGQRTRRTCLTTSNTPNGTTSRSLSRPAQRRAATPVHAVVGAWVQAFVKACFRALAA